MYESYFRSIDIVEAAAFLVSRRIFFYATEGFAFTLRGIHSRSLCVSAVQTNVSCFLTCFCGVWDPVHQKNETYVFG